MNSNDGDDDQQNKLSRLITDLTKSYDSNNDHFEIRQVQQQFSIEAPLPQTANKHKTPYGKNQSFLLSIDTLFSSS